MDKVNITGVYSPDFKIISKYFISSIVSFVLLNLLMVLEYKSIGGHHFQPKILALTHIATLGWISMIIFGALYQLIPVVLEVKLFSEKLAAIHFWIFVVGTLGLVYFFWIFKPAPFLVVFSIILNLAFIIFIVNVILTLRRVRTWNLTGWYIGAALFYLFVTGIAGILMAINLAYPYIKSDHLRYLNLHALVAFVGWVSMIVMGVSYKLIPMFTLSHGYTLKSGRISFVIVNIGLLGLNFVYHIPNDTLFSQIFIIITAIGLLLYLYQITVILKKRIRKRYDIGMKFSVSAFFMFGLTIGIATLFAFVQFYRIVNATLILGFILIFGYLSFLIIGQMYKIVPFLVWYHKYSSKVGLEETPLLKDMYDERLAKINYLLMAIGLSAVIISFYFNLATLILFSFIILFLSSLVFAYNMIKIFRR